MAVRRLVGGVLVLGLVAALAAEAGASPARRLARRGVVVAPPAAAAVPAGPRRTATAVPLAPGGPAVVIGPGGRVRRRLVMPGDLGQKPVGAAAGSRAAAAPLTRTPTAAAVPPVAASPAPVESAARAAPPRPVPVEPIPSPLPEPQPAGDVVPAGVELEIHDGTQSVLVQPAAP